MRILILILAALVGGCAAMVPGPQVLRSDFDSSVEVTQSPMRASVSMTEGLQALGFYWTSWHPDEVVLHVEVPDIVIIRALGLNMDGVIWESEISPDVSTVHARKPFALSSRRFVMTWEDFELLGSGADGENEDV